MYLIFPLAIATVISSIHNETSVYIRVSNVSLYDIESVEIYSPASGLVYFGKLKSREKSDYKEIKQAYSIVAVTGTINNTKIEFLPDDYLGEQPLKPGKYTYQLNVTEKNGMKYLHLQFVVDER